MVHVLGVTGPIYLLIAAGFVTVRSGWMVTTDMRVLGRFVAVFCVPALLFRAISNHPIREVLQGDYLVVYGGGSLISLAAVTLVGRYVLARPMPLAALQGMGASVSNSAFVGYPIVLQLIGPAAGTALALCALVENLLMIPLALALADAGSQEGHPARVWFNTFKALIRNPMIVAILCGIVVSALGFTLPAVLDRAVALAAAAAPPTALFVIGGSLVGLRLAGIRSDIALVAGSKLLLHPLCVFVLVLVIPPADPTLREAAVLYAAMPMLSIYPVLAHRFGYDRFCAAALLAATVASFVTISILIAVLPSTALGQR